MEKNETVKMNRVVEVTMNIELLKNYISIFPWLV